MKLRDGMPLIVCLLLMNGEIGLRGDESDEPGDDSDNVSRSDRHRRHRHQEQQQQQPAVSAIGRQQWINRERLLILPSANEAR